MDVRAKANHCVISMDRIGRLVLPMPIRAAMRLTDGRGELEGELNRETCELTHPLLPLRHGNGAAPAGVPRPLRRVHRGTEKWIVFLL